MSSNNDKIDKAGEKYWSNTWDINPLPSVWNINSSHIKDYVEKETFAFMVRVFQEKGFWNNGSSLIEVGCARSAILPLFAKEMGFKIAGLDYSLNGCEQAGLILEREGVSGQIYNCDIFDIPEDLVENFDVVVSFGLVEHFSDTSSIISALARLVKPGGLILTNIPNMNGAVGIAQKLLNRAVYDIHVPLTNNDLKIAHEKSGLEIISCDYFLSTNFGVVNIESQQSRNLTWWLKKVILAILVRCSMVVWVIERNLWTLPAAKMFSPYINCVAMKQPGK